MPVFGLTGGIGAGKSTVAELLRRRGAVVIDADEVARQLTYPGQPALEEIRRRFGDAVVRPDGLLDRAALARIVFSDPAALSDLNAILHPRIFQAIGKLVAAEDPNSLVFVEAALLAETYSQASDWLDLEGLVVVDAPEDQRVARLAARGLEQAEARARMAAQAGREERLAKATYVVRNSGSQEQLEGEVERLWEELSDLPSRAP